MADGAAPQSVAELFVACLRSAGIDTVYGIPGEENTALIQALEVSGIDFVLTRHEQAAAFMASVHGCITGRPAACLSTLGPGATNLVTGVADANLDHVPLVALTAQAPLERVVRSESHQVIDLEALFAPVTKLSRRLTTAAEVPGAVAEAVRLATEPRPGAVHLSLPADLAGDAAQGAPVDLPRPSRRPADPERIAEAAAALSVAKRPMILAGAGVLRSGAVAPLRALAEATGLPVVTSLAAKGLLPPDHRQTLFALGLPFDDHVDEAVEDADLILAVGFDPVEYPPAGFTLGGRTPVVHFSEQPALADAGWRVTVDVPGALDRSLPALTEALGGRRWPLSEAAIEAREAIRADRFWVETAADAQAALPVDICHVVERQLQESDLVLSGVGAHKVWVSRNLAPRRAGQLIVPNGLAGMGMALPGAIAAARLCPDRQVLAICGDGEFLMNLQDMETAARLGLPLTVLLWEDGAYGLIEWEQRHQTGQSTDLSFGNPRWPALCTAFGWRHRPVDRFGDLHGALDAARGDDAPTLVTIRVDYGGNDRQPTA